MGAQLCMNGVNTGYEVVRNLPCGTGYRRSQSAAQCRYRDTKGMYARGTRIFRGRKVQWTLSRRGRSNTALRLRTSFG